MFTVILAMGLSAGCGEKNGAEMMKMENVTNREEKQSIEEAIQKLLDCDIWTAQSIEQQCHLAGVGEIKEVRKNENVYTILELITEDENYYVFLSDGFFLEQIRIGSEDGEKIYTAME